eukprot:COSAG06_NODE_12880_length_1317_cov_0.878489_1_plen_96_part_10
MTDHDLPPHPYYYTTYSCILLMEDGTLGLSMPMPKAIVAHTAKLSPLVQRCTSYIWGAHTYIQYVGVGLLVGHQTSDIRINHALLRHSYMLYNRSS